MEHKRAIVLFVAAVCLLGAAGGIFDTSYNNYLDHTFHITAEQRGDLELPREFPGFMVAILAGALFFVGEVNLTLVAAGLVGAGMVGLAAFAGQGHQYVQMLVFTVVWSAGAHLMMPANQSLALRLAGEGRTGGDLGKLAAVRALAAIVGYGLVWLNFTVFPHRYPTAFLLGAGAAVVAALFLLGLKRVMPEIHRGPRPKFVFKKRYWLFYLLSALFGARKQVFITFGPWVLIRIFSQPPQTFAKLRIVATVLTVLLVPWVGRLVDRIGVRVVLMADAVLLLCVCLAYGFAQDTFPASAALLVVCGAFVVDQLLFPVQMARTVYLFRIAESRRDITATLGLGVTIDHAVSIPIAMLGGRLWGAMGYRSVFVAAAGIAVITFVACSLIGVRRVDRQSVVAGPPQGR
ncbi:MAG: MFS transporter [Candidatus Brocadiae bacterium]|nr:MFS transporter [Candidatus Brocadiia bacterium]